MLTIRFKLLLGYLALLVLSLTLIAAIVFLGGKIKADVSHLNKTVLPQQHAAVSLRAIAGQLESALYAYYATSINKDELTERMQTDLAEAENLARVLNKGGRVQPLFQELNQYGEALMLAVSNNNWDGARDVLSATAKTQGALKTLLQAQVLDATRLAQQDVESVYGAVSTMLIGAVVFLLLVVLVSVAVALYVSVGIIRPINQLAGFARSVVDESDLNKQAPVFASDEIGDTAQAFNTMLERIRSVVSTSARASGSVAGAVAELNTQLAAANQSAGLQLSNTQDIKGSVLDLQNLLAEVSGLTETAASKAADVSDDAMSGREQLNDTVSKIQRLSQNVANASVTITQLEQQTESIAGLTGTIKEIADQTNLLALNAAIEAARAGEAGRGFAVVADEVRGLSQKTQAATLQIDGTINDVVANVHSVVESMRVNREEAADCAQASQQTEERLKSIMDMVMGVRGDSEKIASATGQSHELSEGIGRQVIQLAVLAGSIKDGMDASTVQSGSVQSSAHDLKLASEQFKH